MRLFTNVILTTTLAATLAVAGNLPGYKVLCNQLENLKGWEVSKCDGMKMTNPMFGEMVTASKNYTKGDKSVEVSVVSGMQAMMTWAPFQTGMTMENDEQLVKVEKIDGFPVGFSYDKQAHSGTLAVLLAPNAVLVLNYDNMHWKEALKMAKVFEWEKLSKLFK
ncbi:MAG TPA: hypothetical protein ENK93_00370 [Campylobacteraceae bacterium]|jgi:hypothetical protein|nr:hypothetical protein [Campylobacteraceae bacterium]HHD83309.1 hypothetical protein [Campylobacteraceae bacterium]